MATDVYQLGYDIVDMLQLDYKLPADLYEINFDGEFVDLIFDVNDYAIHLNLRMDALKYCLAEDMIGYILEMYKQLNIEYKSRLN